MCLKLPSDKVLKCVLIIDTIQLLNQKIIDSKDNSKLVDEGAMEKASSSYDKNWKL